MLLRILIFFILIPVVCESQILKSNSRVSKDRISVAGGVHSFYVQVSDTALFEKWLQKFSNNYHSISRGKAYLLTGVNGVLLDSLYINPNVRVVQRADRVPKVEREVNGIDLSLNGVRRVQHLFPAVQGEGFGVSVKERPFDKYDIDLKNRIINSQLLSEQGDIHASNMATVIGGAGNSSPEGKGVAPRCFFATSDFSTLLPDDPLSLLLNGIFTQNHSYGVGVESFYGVEAQAYDQVSYDHPRLLHVFSSGNQGISGPAEGPYEGIANFANLTGEFKMSKNTLSVGAVNELLELETLSSRGPAPDGRIKPELVAAGAGGTSESAAIVSGLSLLLRDALFQKTGQQANSDLLKSIMVNTAEDAGRPNVDHAYGFGVVNAVAAMQSIDEGNYYIDSLAHGETVEILIEVPAGTAELKVTIVWIDPPSEPGSTENLFNDLDLSVENTSSGEKYLPWVLSTYPHADSLSKIARRGFDHLNNVEQITLPSPVAGVYRIKIDGFSIATGRQRFALAYQAKNRFEWIFPSGTDAIEASKATYVRWNYVGEDSEVSVEFALSGSSNWTLIGTVPLPQRYIRWEVPAVNAEVVIRLTGNNFEFITDSFIVTEQPVINLTLNCAEFGAIDWEGEAESYQIFELGETTLEPMITSSEEILEFAKEGSRHLAVAPLVNARPGYRSRTQFVPEGASKCYILSFFPRKIVTDSVMFDLVLGTTFGLTEVFFERRIGSGFETIATLNAVTETNILFQDFGPRPGTNYYRVGVVTKTGEIFYSEVIPVEFTRNGDLFIYPNPVASATPFYMVVNAETVDVEILDLRGTVIDRYYDNGQIKTIELRYLQKGTYVVRAVTEDGRVFTRRLVVY